MYKNNTYYLIQLHKKKQYKKKNTINIMKE